jgi:acyl dehydratase
MTGTPAPGTAFAPLDKPRFTEAHIVRWMGAQQNWDRIHFDQAFCRDHARLERPVINGALKQHLIVQFLASALPGAWPWRIDYQFRGPDWVGEKLQVRGTAGASRPVGDRVLLDVDVQLVSLDRNEVTTRGRATVLLPADDAPVLDALGFEGPEDLALPLVADPVGDDTLESARKSLGRELEHRESKYPVDLSRLRLFADAVMDLDPVHFDPDVPSPWGNVVAPPLFPLHGLEARPGTYPLSEEKGAQGREAVNEVGRDLAPRFGFSAAGGMNAGNRVQVHSLARVGERIGVTSTLVGARRRSGSRGGDMVFFESLNAYRTTDGRPLLTERQTTVVRLLGAG